MEEVHKAVLKGKIVHNDKIIPVHDKIKDCNTGLSVFSKVVIT